MIIGPHLSIAKGLPEAAVTAHRLGANAFQFFTRNPRGGAARVIPAEEIDAFKKARADYGVLVAAAHMPYTVNLAAEPGRVADFARLALREDLARCAAIGAEFVIVHPGTNPDAKSGREHIIEALREAASASRDVAQGGPMLLLETMAGQGTRLVRLPISGTSSTRPVPASHWVCALTPATCLQPATTGDRTGTSNGLWPISTGMSGLSGCGPCTSTTRRPGWAAIATGTN